METRNDIYDIANYLISLELAADAAGKQAQIITTVSRAVAAMLGIMQVSHPNKLHEIGQYLSEMEGALFVINGSVLVIRDEYDIVGEKITKWFCLKKQEEESK